ncbi:PLP-dependent cysteine synthase family protein [Amphritea pacifica]|uniref:L-cysteine desulfhydrase Cds1 n=1 Tax=Amphritea pacifica TaxID=2811233 RepID=A0ABS2W6S9_9GAMM|nr:PLP-dependent cysteine synthase family protein [Amphritea pacifica]MBN0987415.1 PLP-dependent cysteine synthase family protein [Amphritea pacifica]MBN1006023.1 PLP-dependent cysteine synthase family protein [Amphritea pacifica]
MSVWTEQAVARIQADAQRSADTHLIKLELPALAGIDLYLKDESSHPTGSLKHRLARSLFLYALCNGQINQGTTVIEASSGSTAVSEAYFARMIGVPFVAVMPRKTAKAKIRQVEFYGGRCHFVDCPTQMHEAAVVLAAECNGHFMDQFRFAERATDWRGNSNIAESIFRQMKLESHPVPAAIVMSAGTGGTTATLGRYIRYKGLNTTLVAVDPENSVFYDVWQTGDRSLEIKQGSRIEGIGRPRAEESFQPTVIDRMMRVPDGASVAAMLWLEQHCGRRAGASTGTNLWGMLTLAAEMHQRGEQGSLVTLICDGGERYLDSYYDPLWVAETLGDISGYQLQLKGVLGGR